MSHDSYMDYDGIEETPNEDIEDVCLHSAVFEGPGRNFYCVVCGAYVGQDIVACPACGGYDLLVSTGVALERRYTCVTCHHVWTVYPEESDQ